MRNRWPERIVRGGLLFGGMLLLLPGVVLANSVRFGWSPNVERVAGYKIHYGPASRTYDRILDTGNAVTGTVSNLVPGSTYYFALTAYNAEGLESDYSGELIYFVPTNVAPTTPFRLTIAVTPSNQTAVTVTGATNRTFGIEATTNLTTWIGIGNLAVGASGSSSFTDTNAATQTRRYYRARAL